MGPDPFGCTYIACKYEDRDDIPLQIRGPTMHFSLTFTHASWNRPDMFFNLIESGLSEHASPSRSASQSYSIDKVRP